MPSASTLGAFIAATVVLLLIPGPAILFTLNRSLSDGRRVGLAGVAGLELGDLIQVAAAVAGLSAVISTSAAAFNLVKWAGVVYLVATGVMTLRRAAPGVDPAQPSMTARRAFRQGIIVNALNPKTALFFLSIFPQFVDVDSTSATSESLVLGAVFVVLATLFNGSYALIASALRPVLLRGRAVPIMRRYVSGGLFVGLGLASAGASNS